MNGVRADGEDRCRPLTPNKVIRAIVGTYGIKSKIAARLGCTRTSFQNILSPSNSDHQGEGWDMVRQAYKEECEKLIDDAEDTMEELQRQRLNLPVAHASSAFILERRGKSRGWARDNKVIVEGGDKPLSLRTVDADDLPMNVSQKKELLAKLQAELGGKE